MLIMLMELQVIRTCFVSFWYQNLVGSIHIFFFNGASFTALHSEVGDATLGAGWQCPLG